MGCLKEKDGRLNLPWKEDPKLANRYYQQIRRSNNPEQTIREIRKRLGV